MNGALRASLLLGMCAAVGCGGGASAPATPSGSVVPASTPTPPPPPPPEPVEVLPGLAVLAGPVQRLPDPGWLRTTLDLRVSADAGRVTFDWFAPYAAGGDHSATFWTNVVEWRVERLESNATLHSFDVEWPADKEVGLRFRSDSEVGNDQPTLLCTSDACTVTP